MYPRYISWSEIGPPRGGPILVDKLSSFVYHTFSLEKGRVHYLDAKIAPQGGGALLGGEGSFILGEGVTGFESKVFVQSTSIQF